MSDAANLQTLEADIEQLWASRESLSPADSAARATITQAVDLLDSGQARVAEIVDGAVSVNTWLKHAILLFFRVSEMHTTELGPFEFVDKVPLKSDFAAAGVRVVPGASARYGSYLEPGVVLMPSYVNIGARVGSGSMVDTWATVGSCAQIGRNVHLAGGVGIGGVLEPPEASPVIVEDDVFVGSRCMIVNGARVGAGSKLGAGLIFSSTIPVIDAESGDELGRGVIPPGSIVVSATRARTFPGGEFGLPCALVLKQLAPGETHDKTQLESLLRDHGVATS